MDLSKRTLDNEQLSGDGASDVVGLPLFEEGVDTEYKAGQGADGSGHLPTSIWQTYSAMANTDGGKIYIGIKETMRGRSSPSIDVIGIVNVQAVERDFWNAINNGQKVSRNILLNSSVRRRELNGKTFIEVSVPRAGRRERPIYINGNPMKGTYRRNGEGDFLCDESTVRRLLADADNDSLDGRLLENFGIDDLDRDSLTAYKNVLAATNRDHPYVALEEREFLRSIGAYVRDREREVEGLTIAGLLMFGTLRSIREVLENYHVDYREVGENAEERWIDRVHSDGSWSGNLFDFYRRVLSRLNSDVKIPFAIVSNQRIDDTRVKEALREALVNALIHADYSGELSVLITKRRREFTFRNPGTLRVSRMQAFEGNHSDCRNRNLQTMFLLIGAAEKAGSGLPKIARAWTEQQWRYPLLRDENGPDHTQLRLTTESLLPEESMQRLRDLFGDERIGNLQPVEAIAMCAAHLEKTVSNQRMQSFCDLHPSDIRKCLQGLVDARYLDAHGVTSGTYYSLRDPGRDEFRPTDAVAQVVASDRASDELVKQAVLDVAAEYMSPKDIAARINRSDETLRRRHIPELVKDGKLETKYQSPNSPRQMYRRVDRSSP